MLGPSQVEEELSGEHGFEPKPEPKAKLEQTTPKVLLILGSILERLVTRNDQLLEHYTSMNYYSPRLISNMSDVGTSVKVFNGARTPNISIEKYLERLYKYTKCSPSCFVVGYVYIDRLVHKHPELLVVSLNVHRLLLTSLMIASKMLDDVQYNNAFYAKVGGISNSELNRLELELLFLLDFKVLVSSPVFQSYCWYLEKEDVRLNATLTLEQSLVDFDINDDVNGRI